MPINLPDYSDSEEEKELEAQYKVLRKILIRDYEPLTLDKLIMKKIIPVFKAVVKENASKMGKNITTEKIDFSTFTISKSTYVRYFEVQEKYIEKYFAGKARYFNEFIIVNGCDSLLKLKGKVIGQPIKGKIHLKLWFYEFINDKLKEARYKIIDGNVLPKTVRINEKKIMFNDLLINAGLDCVEEMGKKN